MFTFMDCVAFHWGRNGCSSPSTKVLHDCLYEAASASSIQCIRQAVRPDWAIYWTLGNFSKPLTTINLPKSLTLLGNFCKGVKIFNFTIEIIFGQLLQTFGNFLLVTLIGSD